MTKKLVLEIIKKNRKLLKNKFINPMVLKWLQYQKFKVGFKSK